MLHRDGLAHQDLRLHVAPEALAVSLPVHGRLLQPVEAELRGLPRTAGPRRDVGVARGERHVAGARRLGHAHFGDLDVGRRRAGEDAQLDVAALDGIEVDRLVAFLRVQRLCRGFGEVIDRAVSRRPDLDVLRREVDVGIQRDRHCRDERRLPVEERQHDIDGVGERPHRVPRGIELAVDEAAAEVTGAVRAGLLLDLAPGIGEREVASGRHIRGRDDGRRGGCRLARARPQPPACPERRPRRSSPPGSARPRCWLLAPVRLGARARRKTPPLARTATPASTDAIFFMVRARYSPKNANTAHSCIFGTYGCN